jgi:hypothetical protein
MAAVEVLSCSTPERRNRFGVYAVFIVDVDIRIGLYDMK